MAKKDSVIVEGTMYWPCLTKINEMAGKYTFDLGNLSDDAIAAIESLGSNTNVRTKENTDPDKPDMGRFITLKSKYPIKFRGINKQELSDEELGKLGNGTQVRVKLSTYDTQRFGSYVKMVAGVVLEPVWYTGEDDLFGDGPFDGDAGLDDDIPF